MTDFVLDASALIALLHKEAGWEKVVPLLPDAFISAVNYGETVQRLRRGGMPIDVIQAVLRQVTPRPIPFVEAQAYVCASIHEHTRPQGLSFGDCACLALALTRKATAVTTESVWEAVDLGIGIRRIR